MALLPKEKKTRPPKENKKEKKKEVAVPEGIPANAVATNEEVDEILSKIFN